MFLVLISLQFKNLVYICRPLAGVVELVDTPDLGSGAARCGSSSLPARTIKYKLLNILRGFFFEFIFHVSARFNNY
jgi:hypothetical protein